MGGKAEVRIRQAIPGDGDALCPLAQEMSTSFEPTRETFEGSFARLISDPNAVVLVAAEGRSGRLVGYLLGFRHDSFFADGPVGWVEEIFTRPESRRSGIAASLMEEFERWAWRGGVRLVALATRRAAPFYEAIGYESSAVYFRKMAPD